MLPNNFGLVYRSFLIEVGMLMLDMFGFFVFNNWGLEICNLRVHSRISLFVCD